MKNIVSNIIAQEFEKNVGRWQSKKITPHAMKITFHLNNNWDLEEGYRHLQILIYGPMNYVGVFVKEDWNIIPVDEIEDEDSLKPGCDYRRGSTPWKLMSYHDSCWRSDGLNSILSLHKDRINCLDSIGHWYTLEEVTEELSKQLDPLMSREGDYLYKFMEGVLQFEKVITS